MDRHGLQPARFWKTFTSFASDVDLYAQGPGGESGPDTLKLHPQIPCRQILVVSGGVVVLKNPKGGTDTSPALAPGTVLPVQAQAILSTGSGTTATAVMVFW